MVVPCSRRVSSQAGLAYLALMVAIAIIGVSAAYSVSIGRSLSQHDAEAELLARGLEFQRALQHYANSTPAGLPTKPRALEELLKDPRQPGVVRHLRQIPIDPMTGKADWMLVLDPQQFIVGVHSASREKPLKVAGFVRELSGLEGVKNSYREWVFLGAP